MTAEARQEGASVHSPDRVGLVAGARVFETRVGRDALDDVIVIGVVALVEQEARCRDSRDGLDGLGEREDSAVLVDFRDFADLIEDACAASAVIGGEFENVADVEVSDVVRIRERDFGATLGAHLSRGAAAVRKLVGEDQTQIDDARRAHLPDDVVQSLRDTAINNLKGIQQGIYQNGSAAPTNAFLGGVNFGDGQQVLQLLQQISDGIKSL